MLEIIQENDEFVVKPTGNVVASIVNEFRGSLKEIVDQEKQIIIDLQNVEMIDSMGLGALIATHNSMQKYDQRLKLINVSKDLTTLIKTMRLDQHFDMK
jgi:anti-anti-sigma factor